MDRRVDPTATLRHENFTLHRLEAEIINFGDPLLRRSSWAGKLQEGAE